jgi:hypothetical protein
MENYPETNESSNNVYYYESKKCETLRKYEFPEKELWLTELTSCQDAIDFYGEDSELAEIIEEKGSPPFVLYYHESGTVYFVAPFSDWNEFEQACKELAQFFSPQE